MKEELRRENIEEILTEEESKEAGMRYQDADIDSDILRAVKEMGFETMSPIQERVHHNIQQCLVYFP